MKAEILNNPEATIEPITPDLTVKNPEDENIPEKVSAGTKIEEPVVSPMLTNPTKDEVIQDWISKDLIPNDPRVIKALKDKTVNPVKLQQIYKEKKAKLAIASSDKEINEPKDLKIAAAKDIPIAQKISEGFQHEYNKALYLAGNLLGGVSFGTLDPEAKVPKMKASPYKLGKALQTFDTETTAIAGNLVNMVGWTLGIAGAGEVIGVVGAAAPAIGKATKAFKAYQEGVQAAKTTGVVSKLSKHAKIVGTMLPELAATGMIAGGGKAALKGEKFVDIVSDAAWEGLKFAAFGPAVYTSVSAFGYAMERGIPKARNIFTRLTGKGLSKPIETNLAIKADLQSELAQQTAEEFISPKDINGKIELLEKIKAENKPTSKLEKTQSAWTEQHERFLNGLKKMRDINPQDLSYLENVKDLSDEATDDLISTWFTGPQAQLKPLYDNNEALKAMIKEGRLHDAIDVGQAYLRENIRDYQTLGEFFVSPFMNNSKSASDFIATKIANKLDPNKPQIFNVVKDFLEAPTEGGLAQVQQLAPKDQLKKAFGTKPENVLQQGMKAFTDVRMLARDANNNVDALLKISLDALNPGNPLTFENMSMLRDVHSITKAAVSSRKDLATAVFNSFIKPGMGDVYPLQDINIPKEVSEAVRSQIKMTTLSKRILQETENKRNCISVVTDLKNKIKSATDETKIKLSEELIEARKALKRSTSKLSGWAGEIRAESTTIEALTADQQTQVKQLAAEIAMPDRPEQLRLVMERIGVKENTLYIRAGSELADEMHSMTVGGRDFDISPSSIKGTTIANFRRKLQKELGMNSATERFIVDKLETLNSLRDAELAQKNNQLEQFTKNTKGKNGIKADSKEDDLLRLFAEEKISQTDSEFLALKPEMQEKFIEAKLFLRKEYNDLLDRINIVRKVNNHPEITKREDYITHLHELKDDLRELWNRSLSHPETLLEELPSGRLYNMDSGKLSYDPIRPKFGFEREQTSSEKTKGLKGALAALNAYYPAALDSIYYTRAIRELDAARALAPQRMGEFLTAIKDRIVGVSSPLEKKIPTPLKIGINWIRKRLSKGAVIGNVNSFLQQLASSTMVAANGKRAFASAMLKMGTPYAKEMLAQSQVRKIRTSFLNQAIDDKFFDGAADSLNQLPGTSTTAQVTRYFEKMVSHGFRVADLFAFDVGYLTGIESAKMHGMPKQYQNKYAEAMAGQFQQTFSKLNLPDVFHNTLGKAFMQFQSFSTNLAAMVMYDLPQVVNRSGAKKATEMLYNGYLACTLTNAALDAIGAPEACNVENFIPLFSSAKYGVKGVGGAVTDLAKNVYSAATQDEDSKSSAKRNALRGAMTLGMTGGGQIFKSGEALLDEDAMYNVEDENRKTAYVFGTKSQLKRQKKQEKEEDKDESSFNVFKRNTNKKIKRAFRKAFQNK